MAYFMPNTRRAIAMMHNVPWFANMLFWIPGATETIEKVVHFARGLAARRKENGGVTRDLFYHLASFFFKLKPEGVCIY